MHYKENDLSPLLKTWRKDEDAWKTVIFHDPERGVLCRGERSLHDFQKRGDRTCNIKNEKM